MENLSNSLSSERQTLLQTRIYAVPVLISTGIALYFTTPHEPSLIRPVLVCALFLAMWSWVRGQGDGYGAHRLALLACFWIALGFSAAKLRTDLVATPLLDRPLGPIEVTGSIRALEQLADGKGARILLEDLVMDRLSADNTPHSVRLTIRKGGENLSTGQRIVTLAKFDPPSAPTTPGGFDFRRHAYFAQIGGYGYALGAPKIIEQETERGIGGVFETWRNTIAAQVHAALPDQPASIVTALLTGERASINATDWNALRDSGLAHLLAISGANVDMVALIVFFIARAGMAAFPRLALYYPIKKIAAVIAFAAAALYVALILPATPTYRALVTVGLVLLAVILDRSPISLRLVCVAATVILLIWPEQLLSPSFQLSFAAVTALVAAFEVVGPWLKRLHRDSGTLKRAGIYIVGVAATTVIATLATAPISLYHFQTLALYGVLANALAVPLMTFVIMPLGILAYLFIPFGAAGPLFDVLGVTSGWVLDIAHATARLPGARLTPPALPLSALLCMVIAGLVICLLPGRLRLAAMLPLIVAAAFVLTTSRPDAMIANGGRIVMVKDLNGDIISNTGRSGRRMQDDWLRYWGTDTRRTLKKGEQASIPMHGGGFMLTQNALLYCPNARPCAEITPQDNRTIALYVSKGKLIARPLRHASLNRPWR